MNPKLFTLLPLGLIAPLMAQQQPNPPPRERISFVQRAHQPQERPVELAEAAVHTRIIGPLAETTVTLVLRNPNARDMEGELSYPLPPDATLQGYALDVNGSMVDGVPVPKQKARVAFESEQRQGIDPGLAEWSGGNRFKTRISPIPAQGQRSIRLRYTSPVQQGPAGASYRLPLDFEHVGRFTLRLEAQAAHQPEAQAPGLGNLSFAPWQNLFVLEREWQNLALREDLVVTLPPGMADAPAVEQHGEQYYLAKLITPPPCDATTLPTAGTIRLIWDCSASMEKVDKEPIFEALRLYFAANPNCSVSPVFLHDTLRHVPEWRIENGDASKLIEALKALCYDGATTDLPPGITDGVDLCLLVTDGQVNFADPAQASATAAQGKAPLYAFVATSGVDKAALRRWGAIPIDLLRQTPAQALVNVRAWQLAGVELDGQPWDAALTNAPDAVVDGPLLLTGTLPAGQHEVAVILRSAQGEQRVSFCVDTAQAVQGQLNRSFHAQNKLAALLIQPDTPARKELLRLLGEEYGIVTPGTSLLVLENLEQYLRHEVRPPACCPELRASYDQAISERRRQNSLLRERQIQGQREAALRLRWELQEWYEKEFATTMPPLPSVIIGNAQDGSTEAEINRLLTLAYGYYDLGKYDEAYEYFNRVIQLSPYHEAARRGQEAVSRRRANYYRAAHDSYRARALAEVDAIWDDEDEGPSSDSAAAEEGETGEEEKAPRLSEAPSVIVSSSPAAPAPVSADFDLADEAEEGDVEEEIEIGKGLGDNLGAGGSAYGSAGREEAPAAPAASIHVKAWSPDTPYLDLLKASANPWETYYTLRPLYAQSPGFFLDCADFFEQRGERNFALRVLSNLLEMDWENRALMRAAAYKLRYMGETAKAILIFRKVLALVPEEPQSYRDLALALADAGQWQEAADTMRLVLTQPMDGRFYGVEQVAAVELAHIISRAQQLGQPVNTDGLDPAYLKPFEADVRVVINWDTDLSDMDLWVTDPAGEKCYYGHRLTRSGGHMSRDVTQGYGPEEFLIRKALPGAYKVQANYFGTMTAKMLAPVTLYAELFTDYGRPGEKRQTLIFRLDSEEQVVEVGSISHSPASTAPGTTTRDYQVRAGESWAAIALRELGSAERVVDIIFLNPGSSIDVPPATGSIIRLPQP